MAREEAFERSAAADFSLGNHGESAPGRDAGLGPWKMTARRLRRNRVALAFGVLFILLIGSALVAPLWAEHIAHTTPEHNATTKERIEVDGEQVPVVNPQGQPIGPTWRGEYFLGADPNGRDIMVRLLYGGRNSLMIGVSGALGTILIGLVLGLLAGYYRGWVDATISRSLDVLWAFPVILLGVALGTALALGGLKPSPVTIPFVEDVKVGPEITISGNSLVIPIMIIAVVYVPYLARPVRGQVFSLREKEFVEAARSQGMGSMRIMFSEILPNVASTLVVFFPLLVANAILLEAALSFLGAGVQPPNPSWGTMISEGIDRLTSSPQQTIAPGVMLVLTVLSLNIFGEGVRDALDPRSKLKLDH